jgi:hypothetical protein
MNPFIDDDVSTSGIMNAPSTHRRRSTNPFADSADDDNSCGVNNSQEVNTRSPKRNSTNETGGKTSATEISSNPFDNEIVRSQANNSFDQHSTQNMSNSPEAKRNAGKIPAALPSTKRKSSLLSGQGPIDVSILKEDEKKMILMGVSVQAAQNSLQNTTSLNNAIDSLKAMANSMHGKKTNVWAPPFQLRITDSEVNSTSGKKPFTEYSVLGMRLPSVCAINRLQLVHLFFSIMHCVCVCVCCVCGCSHAKGVEQHLCGEEEILSLLRVEQLSAERSGRPDPHWSAVRIR